MHFSSRKEAHNIIAHSQTRSTYEIKKRCGVIYSGFENKDDFIAARHREEIIYSRLMCLCAAENKREELYIYICVRAAPKVRL